MFFPKYIEASTGDLIIFAATLKHKDIANRLGIDAVSAGQVSAALHTRGKFFAESTTLSCAANPSLDWSQHTWFEASLDKQPCFSTKRDLLVLLGAKDPSPAQLHAVGNVYLLASQRLTDEAALSFFLP